ncbi:MAG: hypothetical protein JWO13_2222 [Acidobacteriales bacterium]|nr:hypothetical protein [Terriglobales bacterium]
MPCDEFRRLAEQYVQTNQANLRRRNPKKATLSKEEPRPTTDLSKQAQGFRKERDKHLANCDECN